MREGYRAPTLRRLEQSRVLPGVRPDSGSYGLVSACISPRSHLPVRGRVNIMQAGIEVKKVGLSPRQAPRGFVRGDVCGFSSSSRGRLMRKLMRLDWSLLLPPPEPGKIYSTFTTLTYPDNFPSMWETWKRDLDVFSKRFYRKFSDAAVIWKMEVKKRKSGENAGQDAPHFHLLTYHPNAIEMGEFRSWLSMAWFEVVNSGDDDHLLAGTSSDPVYGDVAELMSYLSKYLGKSFDTSFHTGRCWGEWGSMPYDDIYSYDIDMIEFCRRVRRWGRNSKYLSGRLAIGGFVVFGRVAALTRGLLLPAEEDINRVADRAITAATSARLRLASDQRKAQREKAQQIYKRIMRTYGIEV